MTLALLIVAFLAVDFLLGLLVGMAIGRRDRAPQEQRRIVQKAAHPAMRRDPVAWQRVVAERTASVTRIGKW